MLRPWPVTIMIDAGAEEAPYRQIVRALEGAIRSGQLPAGSALPGSRKMAEHLKVNRKTVQVALDELVAQGWLVAEGRRGIYVADAVPSAPPPAPAAPAAFSRVVPSAPGGDMIVFDDGAPDTRLFPHSLLARAYRRSLELLSRRNLLAEEEILGSGALREQVALMLTLDRGLKADPGRILLTRGSQMAIFVTARILAGPGDRVAMEDPGYSQARAAFRATGAEIIPVPVDGEGLRVDRLEEACRAGPVRCVYVTPHHHYPTTVTLSPARRRQLLDLAARFGFVIVEDDYDHEFHYGAAPILPLAHLAPGADIVYLGSFSKILTPNLRSGYISAPDWFIRRAARAVGLIDRQGDAAMELSLASLLENGDVQRHVRKAHKIYWDRRDRFAAAVARHLDGLAETTPPAGGLAFWIVLGWRGSPSLLAAAARASGVRVLPYRMFSPTRPDRLGIRLGFAHKVPDLAEQGLARLRRALGNERP